MWSGYKVFEFTNIQPCLRDKHDLRPHHTTQKNYRSHTIARVRDIARVNCRTYTYFFPKQNVIIITQTFLDLQISLFKIIIIFGWKLCILIQITIWDRILIFFQIFTESNLYGSSHLKCSVRKGVLRSFAKFTGKHLCQTLYFDKVAGLTPATLLKKRLWHRCLPVNIAAFLRTPFFTEHLRWMLL